MTRSDLQGGSITITGKNYPATIGGFEVQQVLVQSGFSPTAMVAREDFPSGYGFTRGQLVTANPTSGSPRDCAIYSVRELGPLIELTLRDKNQSA